MRRRQKYAESRSDVALPVIQAALAALESAPLPASIRGQCPKCHKTIGRGIAGHVKACNGNVS